MRWLKNFERLLEIQRNIVWPSILEMEPKVSPILKSERKKWKWGKVTAFLFDGQVWPGVMTFPHFFPYHPENGLISQSRCLSSQACRSKYWSWLRLHWVTIWCGYRFLISLYPCLISLYIYMPICKMAWISRVLRLMKLIIQRWQHSSHA